MTGGGQVNFIQKNPSDPQYEEFHNGEYEYWPLEDAVKSKSISFPAAVVSGLELLAAAAVSGLLAAALAILYVLSSPLALSENSAAINANVYNNNDAQSIVYTLATKADPDDILQDGILEDDESTLFLKNLTAGTTYLLRYYNEKQAQIGDFEFTTPGGSNASQPPEAPDAPEDPEDITPIPTETENPADETVAEMTQETTEPTTEATTEPTVPVYYPPTPRPPSRPDDTPMEPEVPEVEPTRPTEPEEEEPTESTGPTEPTEPEITVAEPDMGGITYLPPEVSGDEIEAYFQFEEYHTFQNVPEENYRILIMQGDTEITEYSAQRSEDGTLFVSFTGSPIPVGKATDSTVTLITGSGTYTSTNRVFPPSLESVDITVVKNPDGTHTFTPIANVVSDGTEELVCEAIIYTTLADNTGVSLPMTAESPERYTASYTTRITPEENPEQAFVIITAYWARLTSEEYFQSYYNYYDYTP